MVDDLIIPPSLFIFHSLHTVFLLFTEIAEEIPVKSILKTGQNDGKKPKHTKKVRITENNNVIMPITIPKKTRKIWYDKTTIPEK
jgi:hypothetical protein